MNWKELFDFLTTLQRNNNKEWMDENRKWYKLVRDSFIQWLQDMDLKLSKVDPNYTHTDARKALNRINNNLLYHPNKPIYKDNFGAGLDQVSKQGDFYIQIGVGNSILAGGFYKPGPKLLKSIRDAIDYNGEELKKIINKKSFKDTFEFIDDGDSLVTAPKGFSQDHEHIDLLRKKTFAAMHTLTKKDILKPDFDEHVIRVYKEMLPFRKYLNQATSV